MTATPRPPSPKEQNSELVDYTPAARLRAALRRFAAFTEHAAREHKLTPRSYELLLFIQAANDENKPATVTSLCEPLQTSQGSVTQLVDRAVRAGLITRTALPDDRRSSHLHLTPTGHHRLRHMYDTLGGERERLAKTIDEHF